MGITAEALCGWVSFLTVILLQLTICFSKEPRLGTFFKKEEFQEGCAYKRDVTVQS
jgi:hypothetical protein